MTTLLINIKELIQIRGLETKIVKGKEMKILPSLNDAYLLIEADLIKDFGLMTNIASLNADKIIDCKGKIVLPTWCDSHTHLVYSGNRESEFVDRINGLTYKEIANKGGGILNSAKKLSETSEQSLFEQSEKRLQEIMQLGTGAVEIKSGYGLTINAELKMLRVIKKLKEKYPIAIKSTFLGAHAIPSNYKNSDDYVKIIIDEMLPRVAEENLADFIDVFCETGYFTPKQTAEILTIGNRFGLTPKIHVNQFTSIGGIQTSIEHNALTVDHLEIVTDKDLEDLKNSDTLPVVLPSCSYFLSIPYAPARKMIDNGLPLAIATDYNPGSTPSGNMNFVISTACIKMRLTPEEAINAATVNGAFAMNLSDSYGSITRGKKANLIITKAIPSIAFIPYSFASNLIDVVLINGEII